MIYYIKHFNRIGRTCTYDGFELAKVRGNVSSAGHGGSSQGTRSGTYRVSILSGPAELGSDPENFGPFISSFITDRALIWYKMVAIFQGSDVWTYLKPSKIIVMG